MVRKTRLAVEQLECREVPAVVGLTALTPVLTNGILTVIGNDSGNTIEVTKSGSNINVLGKSFAASNVKTIVIDGAGGNDVITVSESITLKTFLYGGSGADKIYGGGGTDNIYGGRSGDTLYGRAGADSFFGGSGSDSFYGGSNTDLVSDYRSGEYASSVTTEIGEDPTLTAYSSSSYTGQVVNEILRLVNAARKDAGRSALTLSSQLNTVASDYAKTLDRLNVTIGDNISHKCSGHDRPLLESRLDVNQVSYSSAAENNSYRQTSSSLTAKQAASLFMYGSNGSGGLMNSAGHKANILNASFTKLGLGLSGTISSGYYLTQVFTG